MAKDVQKSNFPKFEAFIHECIERLATDWPKIIGQGANLMFNKYDCGPFEKFKTQVHNKCSFLEYEISGEREGKFCVMFMYKDAIIISGSILMEEENEIKKQISSEVMNDDYKDAFKEFGNQTAASFENIYRNHFPEEDDNHIRFTQAFFPPIDDERLKKIFSAEDDDEILVANTNCSIWSFDKGDINLTFPAEVAENLFNETVTMSTRKVFAHLLLINRNKSDIFFIKKSLRNSGYFIHICTDADDAIAKLQHEKMDLVLLDTDIGENVDDGLSLCLRIKRNMLLEDMPIIMCSANATKRLVMECVRLGASDFLIKPFNKEQLLSRISRQVKRKKLIK